VKKHDNKKMGWKQKLKNELIEYAINVVYLFFFFSAFVLYRRLILAQHEINYLNYGISLIEALILGKVIMIGDIIRLGQKFKHKPLILTILYKSIIFTIWAALFIILESAIKGLIRGNGVIRGIETLFTEEKFEFLARNLVTFLAFIPFFAIKELEEIFGKKKIYHLFFVKKI
jgi:hypothetical protein